MPTKNRLSASILLALALFLPRAHAQQPAPLPTFAVTTVKPSKETNGNSMFRFLPFGISFTNVPFQVILREAYGLDDNQIINAPAWVKTARFDIETKVDETDVSTTSKLDQHQKRQMLQPFLADRFQLKTHYETRDLPVYSLVVAKAGSKLKDVPSRTDPNGQKNTGSFSAGRDRIQGDALALDMLAHLLTEDLHRLVVNNTGLNARYDLDLHWSPDDAPADTTSTLPTLFTAIQEQLGLKLEPIKAPVQVLVIDHIELPTPD